MAALPSVTSSQPNVYTVFPSSLDRVEDLSCAICKTGQWEKLEELDNDRDIDDPNFKAIGPFQSPPIFFAGKHRIIVVHNVCAILAIKAGFVESLFCKGQEFMFKIARKTIDNENPLTKDHYKMRRMTYKKIISSMRKNNLDNELAKTVQKLDYLSAGQIALYFKNISNFQGLKNKFQELSKYNYVEDDSKDNN